MKEKLDLISFVIAATMMVVPLILFWYKLSASQKRMNLIVEKILEESNLFYRKVIVDIDVFKADRDRQQGLCIEHSVGLNKIIMSQKGSEITQNYMKELFEDLKRITINTNETIQNNTTVLSELLGVIRERKA